MAWTTLFRLKLICEQCTMLQVSSYQGVDDFSYHVVDDVVTKILLCSYQGANNIVTMVSRNIY